LLPEPAIPACGTLQIKKELKMKPLFPDMPPKSEEILLERYRRMSPQEKIQIIQDLNQTLLDKAIVEIQTRYDPNLSEREAQLRLASLWLDRETMIKAYGWHPEAEPTVIDFDSLREQVDRAGMEDQLRKALQEAGLDPST
jgi:hypothetical protein